MVFTRLINDSRLNKGSSRRFRHCIWFVSWNFDVCCIPALPPIGFVIRTKRHLCIFAPRHMHFTCDSFIEIISRGFYLARQVFSFIQNPNNELVPIVYVVYVERLPVLMPKQSPTTCCMIFVSSKALFHQTHPMCRAMETDWPYLMR